MDWKYRLMDFPWSLKNNHPILWEGDTHFASLLNIMIGKELYRLDLISNTVVF